VAKTTYTIKIQTLKLDCFYEYMNWYTSGFQGAFIAREGYYSSVPDNAKKFLTEAEWDYWYGGKPAATDITDPFGKLIEKAGRIRDGARSGIAWAISQCGTR
jgi:putative spermidine/putrescine transport system substrate-binding protein